MSELFDELVDIMRQETEEYKRLYDYAVKKREIIVARELEPLESLTTAEQDIASNLKNLEKKRLKCLKVFAASNDMPEEAPTVSEVIDVLPLEDQRETLTAARKELVDAASQMQFMNEQNEVLLKQALEMVEFDLTLFKSLRQAPETANYGRDAYNTGDILPSGGFDAKQ